jgi:hypothetical protein
LLEFQIQAAHLFRSFEFTDLHFREKLRGVLTSFTLGKEVKGTTSKIIDLDGSVREVRVPHFENNGIESVSGILPPFDEPVALVKPRQT